MKIKNVVSQLVRKEDDKYSIRYDLLEDFKIPFISHEHLTYLYDCDKTIIIPTDKKGVEIIKYTFKFIEDLFYYEKRIISFMKKETFPESIIHNFEYVMDTYEKLNLSYLNDVDYILISDSFNEYAFLTELDIYNLSKLEMILKLLPYKVKKTDIKKIGCTPIVFPIVEKVHIYDGLYYLDFFNNIDFFKFIMEGWKNGKT